MKHLTLVLCAAAVAGCTYAPRPGGEGGTQDAAPPVRGGTHGAPPSRVSVYDAAFSPDGKCVLINYTYGPGNVKPPDFKRIRLWDVETGKELHAFSDESMGLMTSLPDSKSVILSSRDRPLQICDATTGKVIRTLDKASAGAFCRAISPDGKYALTVKESGGFQLWDVGEGKLLHTLSPGIARSAKFSPDGKRAFATFSPVETDTRGGMFDVATGENRLWFQGEEGWKYPLAFSPDGELAVSERPVAAGPREQTQLVLWEWATARELRGFDPRPTHAGAAAFTPDGQAVLSLEWDGTLRRWSVATGKELSWAPVGPDRADAYAMTPDGRLALTADGEDTRNAKGIKIRLWDTATGTLVRTLTDQDNR